MKTNPRNVPRTEADVRRARREGWVEGLRLMEALFLLALCDKCPEVDAVAVWMEVCEKTKSSDKRYFTAADVRNTLREEYGIDLLGGPSKAIAGGGGGQSGEEGADP